MPPRTLLRAALDVRWTSPTYLPPTYLLPLRARLHQATIPSFQNTPPEIPPLDSQSLPSNPETRSQLQRPSQLSGLRLRPSKTPPLAPKYILPLPPAQPSSALKIPSDYVQLLSQPPFYVTAHIHGRPYLLTTGDTLRLPFHMPMVLPGDILRLNRASIFGSRDFTLKGGYDGRTAYIDERLFTCRVRVMGVESEPMRIKEKKKRRQRRTKHVRSKHWYTVLRVMEVSGMDFEAMAREGSSVAHQLNNVGMGNESLRLKQVITTADPEKSVATLQDTISSLEAEVSNLKLEKELVIMDDVKLSGKESGTIKRVRSLE